MERPQHELAAIAAQGKKNKTVSLGLVIGIHVVIIGGLIVGLSNDQLRKEVLDISASVIAKKEAPKELPPPPPAMVRPPPQAVAPPPQIVIQAAPPPPVVVPKAAPPPPPPPTELKQIARTHTKPPYPALSQRMGEQGTTRLKVSIDTTGKVTEVSVVKGSGSQRLDDAAAQWVKDNYRWEPPTQAGKPVATTTELDIVWDLKSAQ
jgi:protein TonB